MVRVVAAIVLLASCAPAERGRDHERISAPIIGGAPDDAHAAVVAIARADGDTCSGAVVAPRVVLTAGHCAWGVTASQLSVTFGPDGAAPLAKLEVARIVPYPTATKTEADPIGGVDLTALELTRDAPVAPLVISAPATSSLRGRAVTAVGYGRRDPFDPKSAGVRYAVSTPVLESCARMLRLGDDAENVCAGDSGGAVMLDGALLALVSHGRDGCSTPSYATRLDAHLPWLSRIAAGRLDEPCPECVTADASCTAPVERSLVTERPTELPGSESNCGVGPRPARGEGASALCLGLCAARLGLRAARRSSRRSSST